MKHARLLGFVGMVTIGLTAACGGSSEFKTPAAQGANPAPSEDAKPGAAQEAAKDLSPKPGKGIGLESIRQDPCQMVTQAEAEAIFGRPAEAPSKGDPVGIIQAFCHYSVVHRSGEDIMKSPSAGLSLMFSPDKAKGKTTAKSFFANTKTGVPVVEPVAGLGDEAHCISIDAAFPPDQIFVRVGDLVLNAVTKDCATSKKFLEKALSRI